jgi:hypothetical protein
LPSQQLCAGARSAYFHAEIGVALSDIANTAFLG